MTSYSRTARGNGKQKSARKQDRKIKGRGRSAPGDFAEPSVEQVSHRTTKRDTKPFVPMTENQGLYVGSMYNNDLTFGLGPAGTGKTYCAVSVACEMFIAGRIERMVFSRPAVGAEENLGFYTGDENEKIANWVIPIREVLNKKLGSSHVEFLEKRGTIRFQPFATMRGLDWPNTFAMVDEAQNTTPNQMKLFLSRAGEGSVLVVDGDPYDQKDIKGVSGIEDALHVLKGVPGVGVIKFDVGDIVRSGFVKRVILAYRNRK